MNASELNRRIAEKLGWHVEQHRTSPRRTVYDLYRPSGVRVPYSGSDERGQAWELVPAWTQELSRAIRLVPEEADFTLRYYANTATWEARIDGEGVFCETANTAAEAVARTALAYLEGAESHD